MTKLNRFILVIGCMLAIVFAASICRIACAGDVDKLIAHIEKFFTPYRPASRYNLAIKMIPVIKTAATKYKVDPLLISITISGESSWRPNVTGPGGEYGLGQLMMHLNKGVDYSTPEGQIDGTAKRLRQALDRCGIELEAINHYMTGRCKRLCPKAQRRYRIYRRANETD